MEKSQRPHDTFTFKSFSQDTTSSVRTTKATGRKRATWQSSSSLWNIICLWIQYSDWSDVHRWKFAFVKCSIEQRRLSSRTVLMRWPVNATPTQLMPMWAPCYQPDHSGSAELSELWNLHKKKWICLCCILRQYFYKRQMFWSNSDI